MHAFEIISAAIFGSFFAPVILGYGRNNAGSGGSRELIARVSGVPFSHNCWQDRTVKKIVKFFRRSWVLENVVLIHSG